MLANTGFLLNSELDLLWIQLGFTSAKVDLFVLELVAPAGKRLDDKVVVICEISEKRHCKYIIAKIKEYVDTSAAKEGVFA